jgi:hypothetical protein
VFAVCLSAVLNPGADAEESLYPHAERESGPWGYIDKTGSVVIPLQFEWAEPFSEGLAAVRLNKKSGFIDNTGRLVIQPRFDRVRPFQSGRASVGIGPDWGFIDRSGSEVVPLSYAFTQSFSGDRASVGIRGTRKTGALDPSGQLVIAPEFEGIAPFSEGLAKATRGGKFGYIDPSGKVVAPFEFDHASEFRDARAVVRRESTKEWGFVDKTGALTVLSGFDLVFQPSEGLALVADKQRRMGAIDPDRQMVIPLQFAHAGSANLESESRRAYGFQEGLLPVSYGGGFGYIDRQGSFVIRPQFRSAGPFQDGVAVVLMDAKVALHPNAKGGLAGLVDRSGKLVAPPIYDWAKRKPDGLVQVKFGERLGYLDAKGRPLTFTDNDIEAYLAERREELKPPPPGRAVVGKAGDTEYYLHLPSGICLLDLKVPQDRKVVEGMSTKGAVEMGAAQKELPQVPEAAPRDPKKKMDNPMEVRWLTRCDELDAIRSGGDKKALRTIASVAGMQKDRHDPSGNAAIVYMAALMCRLADRDSAGAPHPKDNSARVWTAFKRLEEGESTSLPALAFDGIACYSARVAPTSEKAGTLAQAKAKVVFQTLAFLPDWLVMIFADRVIAGSPDALFQELEQQKALVGDFVDANLKKSGPSKRP